MEAKTHVQSGDVGKSALDMCNIIALLAFCFRGAGGSHFVALNMCAN